MKPVHDLIAGWTDRLRTTMPEAVAILLKGSHVRGDAGPHSDLDFDVLIDGLSENRYPFWIEPDADGQLRHVSVAVRDITEWCEDSSEPEPWAFGLPVRESTRLLWASTPSLRGVLDRPWREHPGSEPEIEDWVESYAKMWNARHRGDELGLRQAAQGLARYTPTVLRHLNPHVWATSPRTALDLVLTFPIAPPGYREDMVTCLGLSAGASPEAVMSAGTRIAIGTLQLLREHIEIIAPLIDGDATEYLRDGTLQRYVESLAIASGASNT